MVFGDNGQGFPQSGGRRNRPPASWSTEKISTVASRALHVAPSPTPNHPSMDWSKPEKYGTIGTLTTYQCIVRVKTGDGSIAPANLKALRELVKACIASPDVRVFFAKHERERMAQRIVTIDNVYKVLVGGPLCIVRLPDYRTAFAAWTYTAEAQQARVVFSSTTDENCNAVIVISVVRLK